jgi:hypothetical protein
MDKKSLNFLKGLLFGDGCSPYKNNQSGNIIVASIFRPYLEYLDCMYRPLTSGVRKHDGQDCFVLTFRTSSQVKEISEEIYSKNGEKDLPNLTPKFLLGWYCSDGSLKYSRSRFRELSIHSCDEKTIENFSETQIFDKFNFYTYKTTTSSGYRTSDSIQGRVSTTNAEEFLDYIGEPMPCFEYKWCCADYKTYNNLKEKSYEYSCSQKV